MKNNLPHIVINEMTIFDKNNLKSATWRLSTYKKPSNILISKKVYGLKIAQSVIYVFLYPERYYTSTK